MYGTSKNLSYQHLINVKDLINVNHFIVKIFQEILLNRLLVKLKMPISQEQNMIQTRSKNWHVQENQLLTLRNMRRALSRAGHLLW